jgi:hypothetical protein
MRHELLSSQRVQTCPTSSDKAHAGVTRAIMKEIETAQADQFKKQVLQLPRGDFEPIAFLNITSMSSFTFST